jgi:hypothetical protein
VRTRVLPVGRGIRTLVITRPEVITCTMEMGPGSQKAKNTIGPDLRCVPGNAFVWSEFQYRSSIPRAEPFIVCKTVLSSIFPGHFLIITKQSKMIQLAECAED